MWLVFDFSMTDRHCFSKGDFNDGRLGSPSTAVAVAVAMDTVWRVAAPPLHITATACALDKVWPTQPGRTGRQTRRTAAQWRIPAVYRAYCAVTSRVTIYLPHYILHSI